MLNHLHAFFRLTQNEKLTDSELMEKLADSNFYNEITREPLMLEDSPGNITIVRKFGRYAGVNLYNTNGAPYSLKSTNYFQKLRTKDLISALKDEEKGLEAQLQIREEKEEKLKQFEWIEEAEPQLCELEGKKNVIIIPFDEFYLEFQGK